MTMMMMGPHLLRQDLEGSSSSSSADAGSSSAWWRRLVDSEVGE